MNKKSIGVVTSIIIAVAIVSAIIVMQNNSQDSLDAYAMDNETVLMKLQNKEPILVIDIRSQEQYQIGHLEGASHDILDSATLEKRVKTIQSRLPEVASNYNLVLIDEDGTKSQTAAQTMTEMGLNTYYLENGMQGLSDNLIPGSQTVINSVELTQKIASNEDIFLLDVRQPEELLESKIEGSVNIPLSEIFEPNAQVEIPTDKPVVIICGSGNRATIASYALAQEGIDFQILEGGINAWNSQYLESGM